MAAADIRAGRAFVELLISDKAFVRGLLLAKRNLQDFGRGISDIGSAMARVGGTMMTAFGAVAASLAIPIKAAGDMMETTSKFNAVFAENAAGMRTWSDTFSTAVGRAKSDTMNGLAAFQAMFTGLGFGADEAAAMSREMQQLAVDFGSFHNVSDPESIQRFISALAGSAQVLDMYGISIREGTLNIALLARGFPEIAKGATEAQKTLARMDIIRSSMGRQGAIGDAIRTAGSFSNQMRSLRAAVLDTSVTIGNALLPVVTPLVSKAREMAVAFATWLGQNKELVVTFAQFVVAATAVSAVVFGIGTAITWVGGTITAIGGAIGGIATVIGAAFTPVGVAVLAVAGIVAGLTYWMTQSAEGAAYLQAICDGLTVTLSTVWSVIKALTAALFAGDWARFGAIIQSVLTLSWELFKDFARNVPALLAWGAGRAVRAVMDLALKLIDWLFFAASKIPDLLWSALTGGGTGLRDVLGAMLSEFGAGLSAAGPQTLGTSTGSKEAYAALQKTLATTAVAAAVRPAAAGTVPPAFMPTMPTATSLARTNVMGGGMPGAATLIGPAAAGPGDKLTGIAGKQLAVLQGIYQKIDRLGLAYT